MEIEYCGKYLVVYNSYACRQVLVGKHIRRWNKQVFGMIIVHELNDVINDLMIEK